jgi:hypothetical protein
MRTNLAEYGGPVMMIAVTPPGTDRLPWDCQRQHVHSGPRGCRVEAEAADEWSRGAPAAWKRLREAARLAALRRCGMKPTLLQRVWEPQKRGVPHLHVVFGMGSEPEKIAAHVFVDELARLAPAYGFGHVQEERHEMGARDAARYLVGYLLGRSRRKSTIRENIAHPRMPKSLIWLTPNLTRVTKVTMRRLRLARWYLATLAGRCLITPKLYGQDLVDVAKVAVRLELDRPPPDYDPERAFYRHMAMIRRMRRLKTVFA